MYVLCPSVGRMHVRGALLRRRLHSGVGVIVEIVVLNRMEDETL